MDTEFRGDSRDAARRAVAVLIALERSREERAAAVRAVLRRFGETDTEAISVREIDELAAAADTLQPVITAPDTAAAAAAINGLLDAYAGTPRLTDHGGSHPWHLHVDGDDDGPFVRWFMASTAMALAVLVSQWQAPPLRECASASCRRPFVHSERGAPRRYCCATCGTRERVARLRERQA